MDLEADWWKKDGLANDIYIYLCEYETRLPPFLCQSPQLSSRRHLVDWLAIICQSQGLSTTVEHLAVLLMDLFMDHHAIKDHLLKLVALGSLLVAAKFDEWETSVPTFKQLSALAAPITYTNAQFINIEIKLLSFFEWSVGFPTAAHFADYFIDVGVSPSDFHFDQPIGNTKDTVKEYLQKYVQYFLEISLQDHLYRKFSPSLVCAACVASARSCLQVGPVWNMTLQKVTKYTWLQLKPIVEIMLKTHSMDCQMSQYNKLTESPNSTGSSLPATPAMTPETPRRVAHCRESTPVTCTGGLCAVAHKEDLTRALSYQSQPCSENTTAFLCFEHLAE